MTTNSRRDFLKLSALGATSLAVIPLIAEAKENNVIHWDKEYDVIVVGSGFAGLAAAITTAEAGVNVLMMEKMGRFGGNSVINGGLLAVCNSGLQQKTGIKDSIDLMMKDMLKAGRGLNHPALTKIIAENSKNVYDFVIKRGCKFKPELAHLGGHSVPRSYWTKNTNGSGIVRPLHAHLKTLKTATVQKRTKLDEIIQDEAGSIIGIKVREKYKFNSSLFSDDIENKKGKVKYYKINKGLVMASGGFAQDKFLRKIEDPSLEYNADSTNQIGATAGSLNSLLNIGAVPVQLSWIQSGPWASPDEKGLGVGSLFNVIAGFRFGIMVDVKDGKRFMNELADRRTRAQAMFKVIGNDKNYPISICDSEGVRFLSKEYVNKTLSHKVVHKFNTIKELAAFYKLPFKTVNEEINKYNSYVNAKKDPEFGKPVDTLPGGTQINKAPFYGMRGVPKVHHTMGGVDITTKAEVISLNTQKIIPKLFAAGEITGGSHGGCRLGSCAITDCLVFGIVAGEGVLKV